MTVVMDTGPLTHFAQAGILPLLQHILSGERCVHPPQVGVELDRGTHRLLNQQALTATWVTEVPLTEQADALVPVVRAELGGDGNRNLGEAQCVALALTESAVTYLDDGDGCRVAEKFDVEYCTTLELLDDAISNGLISADDAAAAVDALLGTGYRLPFSSGEAFLTALGRC